ncbi:MAG: hypothetical protein JAY94_11890 [Candidatus Thiodiazotropha endolucinida]|nr:hypothetical protein [Candidatus Thiodiazotropha taylori]MCW4318210.1 hypothetical protein [Candidatus Thiodiazotropha taylori]
MTPGTFLFDGNFRFHDGEIGRKIFVVLNNGSSGNYIAAKTTSRGDRYGIQHGCQILDRFPNYHFVKGSCFLSDNTWVQLDAFYEFNAANLMQKVMTGQINRIGIIDTKQAVELLVCTTHSEDLTNYQDVIISETLDNLKADESGEAAC